MSEPFAWTWKHKRDDEKYRRFSKHHPGYELGSPYEVMPLYQAQPPAESVMGIKPLRWKGPDSSGEFHSLDGLWGYIIRPGNGNGFWLTEVGGYFPTVLKAQAAAWADYEARVRAALSAVEGSEG